MGNKQWAVWEIILKMILQISTFIPRWFVVTLPVCSMTLKELMEILVPAIAYVVIFLYQKQKIGALTDAINAQKTGIEGQKAAIEAQTSVVTTLKAQADAQVAITTRLEAIVDRTERHATTVLTNHEKLIQIIEDRAKRESQELQEGAEREKQKMIEQLEEARSQLSLREESIKEAGVQPELASLLTSLSQESFATREILTTLRNDLTQVFASTQRPYRFDISGYVYRINDPVTRSNFIEIYNRISSTIFLPQNKNKEFVKAVLESERAFIGKDAPIVINHLLFKLISVIVARSGITLSYQELWEYADEYESELGPYIMSA